ncbi:insulinoma-associated protein 1a-like [Coregonus clupeaformis]|uniref:insulinoma-associated protein 1a-like n=1 Tax=Coregonus clupeaformis TaxID=59861 RepID=UPI001E1C39DE|nr:insulinoma-associated protein 1a-like [Coregonus clupeaformis]
MPKGFLIKRSKKAGPVSYRIREEDLALDANCSPLVENTPAHALPSVCHNFIRVLSPGIFGGMPESHRAPSLSPTRPDSEGYQYTPVDAAHQMLSFLSPAPSDTFPEANLGSFTIDGSPVSPSLPEMTTRLDTMCGNAKSAAMKRPASSNAKSPHTNYKKRKSSSSQNQEKKSSVRDEVTTSPVLGLRITEEAEDEVKQRSNTSSPLGEFICQLCKERYADPLTLAFHKCSRIVRVEYRCDECDKVFSCPANLASHRRWHKPKGFQVERVLSQREESRPDTPTAREALPPSPLPSDSGSDEEIMFSCPQCSKKFRKQAYLRKHLALHNRKAASHPQNQSPSAKVSDQQHISPLKSGLETPEPSAKYAGTECITKVTGEVIPCRFCGDNFFSSPGLTGHINKYHPTESRQVIVLSQTI